MTEKITYPHRENVCCTTKTEKEKQPKTQILDGKNKKTHPRSETVKLIDKLRFNLANPHRYILDDITLRICFTKKSNSFT